MIRSSKFLTLKYLFLQLSVYYFRDLSYSIEKAAYACSWWFESQVRQLKYVINTGMITFHDIRYLKKSFFYLEYTLFNQLRSQIDNVLSNNFYFQFLTLALTYTLKKL